LLLLDDDRFVRRASPETALDKQPMQLGQRRYGYPRRPQRHSGAGDRIEHPRGHDDEYAAGRFDVNDLAARTALPILAANTPPIEGVPAVTDFYFLPDMGRMTARLRWGANHGSSPAPNAVPSAPPSWRR
jgi:hypothetical protein